jgi:hypothetical protein
MKILFWICRDEEQERWLVLIEDQIYGEYLDEETAVLDAIDLANDARVIGNDGLRERHPWFLLSAFGLAIGSYVCFVAGSFCAAIALNATL